MGLWGVGRGKGCGTGGGGLSYGVCGAGGVGYGVIMRLVLEVWSVRCKVMRNLVVTTCVVTVSCSVTTHAALYAFYAATRSL